jgi:tRNA G18 (ribose-2'-O)-methylase SpoU
MLCPLDSVDDPRLAPYRDLKRTNLTRWSGLFIAEGDKLVRRLLASDFPVESVVLGRRHVVKIAPLVPDDVPIYVLRDEDVETLVGFDFHRGVLACGRRRPGSRLADMVLPAVTAQTLVVLPEIHDPENLGSIVRTSSAFGVDGVILGQASVDPFSRRVLRVSMGAVFSLPIAQPRDLIGELALLRDERGFELVAAVLDESAEPLESAARGEKLAVLFGSEGHGLERRWLDLCQRQVTVPMQPGIDSLNVSVAAAIVLYHFTRSRPRASPC